MFAKHGMGSEGTSFLIFVLYFLNSLKANLQLEFLFQQDGWYSIKSQYHLIERNGLRILVNRQESNYFCFE